MERSYFIKLTVVLYKVTTLFPKGEPLKSSLRKRANEILAGSILVFGENPLVLVRSERKKVLEQIIRDIEVIQALFEVAESQGWVKQENFSVLKREYRKVGQYAKQAMMGIIGEGREVAKQEPVRKETAVQRQAPAPEAISLKGLGARQKKIVQLLKERGTAQVQDLLRVFPDLSRRTLRRDFEFLLSHGLVERVGKHSETMYRAR